MRRSSRGEVVYFAAHMLLSAVRVHWRAAALTHVNRSMLHASMMDLCNAYLNLNMPPVESVALAAFGSAVCLVAAHAGVEALSAYLGAILAAAGGASTSTAATIALEFLKAVGEELLARPTPLRAIATAAVRAHLSDLLRTLEALCTGVSVASLPLDDASAATAPLPLALLTSLSLSPLASSVMTVMASYCSCGMTLGALQGHRPRLLACVIVVCASAGADSVPLSRASGVLCDLVHTCVADLEATARVGASGVTEGDSAFALATGVLGDAWRIEANSRPHASNRNAMTVEDTRATAVGLQSVLLGLAIMHARFKTELAADDGDADNEHGFVRACACIAASVCIPAPRALVLQSPADVAARVLDILLDCTEHRDMTIIETVGEVWPALASLPVQERGTLFGPPLFDRLAERLLRGCGYPDDFPVHGDWTAYTSGGTDESLFTRVREQVLLPAVERTCALASRSLLASLHAQLQYAVTEIDADPSSDAQWISLEALLFALRACSLALRSIMRNSGEGDGLLGDGPPSPHEQRSVAVELLMAAFHVLARSPPILTRVPRLCEAASRFTSTFAHWMLSHCPAPVVDGVLTFLVSALSVRAASGPAARALRSALTRTTTLASSRAPLIQALLTAMAGGVSRATLDMEDVSNLALASMRVVSSWPFAHAIACIHTIIDVGSQHLQRLAAVQDQVPALRAARQLDALEAHVCDDLQLLTSVASHMGMPIPASATHPCVTVLHNLWQLLVTAAQVLNDSSDVFNGITGLVSALMGTARDAAASLFTQVLTFMLALHTERPSLGTCDAIGIVLEAFVGSDALETVLGGGTSAAPSRPHSTALYTDILARTCAPVFSRIMATETGDAEASVLSYVQLLNALGALLTLAVDVFPLPAAKCIQSSNLLQACGAMVQHGFKNHELTRTILALIGKIYSMPVLVALPAAKPALQVACAATLDGAMQQLLLPAAPLHTLLSQHVEATCTICLRIGMLCAKDELADAYAAAVFPMLLHAPDVCMRILQAACGEAVASSMIFSPAGSSGEQTPEARALATGIAADVFCQLQQHVSAFAAAPTAASALAFGVTFEGAVMASQGNASWGTLVTSPAMLHATASMDDPTGVGISRLLPAGAAAFVPARALMAASSRRG